MRLRWLRRALIDLDAVEHYISNDNLQDVVSRIFAAVALLKDQPGIGRPGRVPDTKELVIPALPYIVPYRVMDNEVHILRVYHTSRKWPNRL